MKQPVEEAACGTYTLFALTPDTLFERPDGTLELWAEARYRVRLGSGSERDVLRGALDILGAADEGLLRFGNFIGQAELGGRTLAVGSSRLSPGQVDAMLDDIEQRVAALPFAHATPVLAAYERDAPRGPNVLYHAYTHLRDGMRAVGRHDLPAAVERILAQPHAQLNRGAPTQRPIATVDRLDPDVYVGILTHPGRLRTVEPSTRAAASATATRLAGRLPDVVDVRTIATSYDTAANRFVLAALDAALDIARRFIAAAREKRSAAMAANIREAQAYARRLDRWRRHRLFDGLLPATAFPLESTVLRGRAGYRQLTRWYIDLLARSRRADDPGIAHLLELRDAAAIYEHWCYYEVVDAASRALGRAPSLRPLPADEWGVTVPWAYCADFGDVLIESNRSYSRPAGSTPQCGTHSYSVRLRPDISVRAPGRFHLLDAKLKRDIASSFGAEDDDAQDLHTATFKKADIHKMHAYRDALGASSVWVLYPGDPGTHDKFRNAWTLGGGSDPQGVGALAVVPGECNEHLNALVAEMLAGINARSSRP